MKISGWLFVLVLGGLMAATVINFVVTLPVVSLLGLIVYVVLNRRLSKKRAKQLKITTEEYSNIYLQLLTKAEKAGMSIGDYINALEIAEFEEGLKRPQ